MKESKDQSLANSLSEPWKKCFEEGRFSFFDCLVYHRTKASSMITMVHKDHINTIFQECQDNISSGHFSEERTIERVKGTAWGTTWKDDTSEYCFTCERCQNVIKPWVKDLVF